MRHLYALYFLHASPAAFGVIDGLQHHSSTSTRSRANAACCTTTCCIQVESPKIQDGTTVLRAVQIRLKKKSQ